MPSMRFLLTLLIGLLSPLYTLSALSPQEQLQQMTLKQKVGQLFIAAVYPNQSAAEADQLLVPHEAFEDAAVSEYQVGGILLKYRWTTTRQERERIDQLQGLASTPLFVMQDLENGLGIRISDGFNYPRNMTLGAIQDSALLYELGTEIGRQARALGVNFALAPVVDINSNPENPVIHLRAYGDDKERVAAHGVAWMQGLQSQGLFACAKHFPGHGDTRVDSHDDLPTIEATREKLEEVELYPFRRLIDAGVAAVMTSHVTVPNVDSVPHQPCSLSPYLVSGLLRQELQYQGLIVTDDLLMGAITRHMDPGEVAKRAFLAGNDLIMSCHHARQGMEAIEEAVESREISLAELDARVLRVLEAKAKLFAGWEPLDVSEATPEKGSEAVKLREKLYNAAVTLVYGESCLPIGDPARVAVAAMGGALSESLLNLNTASTIRANTLVLVVYDALINRRSGYFAVKPGSDEEYNPIWSSIEVFRDAAYAKGQKVIVVWLGSPYGVRGIPSVDVLLVGYENDPDAQSAVARILTGELQPTGRLPIRLD